MTSKTSFELLPEDLQGHITGYLQYNTTLELQKVSSSVKHVTKHILHVDIDGPFSVSKFIKFVNEHKRLQSINITEETSDADDIHTVIKHLPETLQNFTMKVLMTYCYTIMPLIDTQWLKSVKFTYGTVNRDSRLTRYQILCKNKQWEIVYIHVDPVKRWRDDMASLMHLLNYQ